MIGYLHIFFSDIFIRIFGYFYSGISNNCGDISPVPILPRPLYGTYIRIYLLVLSVVHGHQDVPYFYAL